MKTELEYKHMRKVTYEEYRRFLESHDHVMVEETKVDLHKSWVIDNFQPAQYTPEEWTVWSFQDRGNWATHIGNYRGNWSPYVPRNLIDRYTKPGELVCDPMMGSGTTLVECKLMGRNGIGIDINPDAVMVAMNRLDFQYKPLIGDYSEPKIELFVGDARNLDAIEDGKVDLIATHPPYSSIIPYTKSAVEGDLSSLSVEDFIEAMGSISKEFYRVLKEDGNCAILIGDTRRHKHYVPVHVAVLGRFLDTGFLLREDIIKLQHHTKTTREKWRGHNYDFYKIAHEHLYVFRKPKSEEKLSLYKYSMKWW